LLLKSRQIGALANHASIMLTRVLDDMANDGFYPQLAISAIDHGLHGMTINEIPEEELKRVREEYAKKYNENPLQTRAGTPNPFRVGMRASHMQVCD